VQQAASGEAMTRAAVVADARLIRRQRVAGLGEVDKDSGWSCRVSSGLPEKRGDSARLCQEIDVDLTRALP